MCWEMGLHDGARYEWLLGMQQLLVLGQQPLNGGTPLLICLRNLWDNYSETTVKLHPGSIYSELLDFAKQME